MPTLLTLPLYLHRLLFLVVGVAGLVGIFFAATTRDDAYDAGNRQGKWTWVAILAGATVVSLLQFPFLAWFGAVAIGIYFFDVRPQLNNIIRGNYGW
ncbi:DUF2516 family protein [Corynebacterium sp. LK2510]|nr:DUF2516 family protein [Corynebacterium sp.]MDY5786047.1 DUF2516 family protein [Corynebacterium sp.]